MFLSVCVLMYTNIPFCKCVCVARNVFWRIFRSERKHYAL